VDIAACVEKVLPDARFVGSATIVDRVDWVSREWVDEREAKPTWAQLEAVSATVDIATAEPDRTREEKIDVEMRAIAEKALISRGEIEATSIVVGRR